MTRLRSANDCMQTAKPGLFSTRHPPPTKQRITRINHHINKLFQQKMFFYFILLTKILKQTGQSKITESEYQICKNAKQQ